MINRLGDRCEGSHQITQPWCKLMFSCLKSVIDMHWNLFLRPNPFCLLLSTLQTAGVHPQSLNPSNPWEKCVMDQCNHAKQWPHTRSVRLEEQLLYKSRQCQAPDDFSSLISETTEEEVHCVSITVQSPTRLCKYRMERLCIQRRLYEDNPVVLLFLHAASSSFTWTPKTSSPLISKTWAVTLFILLFI